LIKIDREKRVATFKNSTGTAGFEFDFLHFVPPQTAPEFVRTSDLANAAGWLDVHKTTLQHNKYPNVFGLGDVAGLPTSKTAAAIYS
jgi:sulfide:quinone oxidoreductase